MLIKSNFSSHFPAILLILVNSLKILQKLICRDHEKIPFDKDKIRQKQLMMIMNKINDD